MTTEASTLVEFVILADDSAAWEVAGLPQLDRLVLVLNEFAEASGSQVMIDAVIFWRPEIPSAARWLPRHAKIKRVRLTESLASLQPGMRVLNTRLFVGRNDLGEFLQTAPVVTLEEPMTEPSILWPRLFEKFQTSHAFRAKTGQEWRLLENQADIDKCAGRLLRHAGKSQDGLVSRFLNRPISRRITRFLLKFPIHPSAWTISIFVLPLIASVFLVRGDYLSVLLGAAIFQVFSILDGCDGEIARAMNLESKFGERLDYFSDFIASLLYVLALGLGLHRSSEGIVCAVLITANELLLRAGKSHTAVAPSTLHESFYARHHGMIGHSGLLHLGERFVWWLFQLTKRDMALVVFLMLALLGLAPWILHLWVTVAGASLVLSAFAVIRGSSARGDIVTQKPRS